MNDTQPKSNPNNQGATILLLGFLILLISCALILTVRVHVRLGALTDELIKLNAIVNAKATKSGETEAKSIGSSISKPQDMVATEPPTTLISGTQPVGERRSPIPQPGERFEKPLLPAKLGEKEEVKPIADAPKEGEVVPWDKAHLHMGRTITVEGKIISTKRQATICFLNFTNETTGGESFYLVVFKSQFDDWGGFPEQAFLNKTVRVTGEIEEHKGRPQLKINKKEQVVKME